LLFRFSRTAAANLVIDINEVWAAVFAAPAGALLSQAEIPYTESMHEP
jgi:hypothetical protein